MPYISKRVGHFIQAWAAILIAASVYFELYVRDKQPIYDMLDEVGEYENSFNYLTGWPLFVLTNFYYFLACVQHPGSPEGSWVRLTQSIANPVEAQICDKCNSAKPERCSHCKRCDICITKRDHHCDFTNQCVGAGNYKAFFWFTVFTAVSGMQTGCAHVSARSMQWFYHYYMDDMESVRAVEYNLVLLHMVFLPQYVGVMLFCAVLTRMNFRNSFTNCTRIDVINTMDYPPICCGQVYEPMNVFDLGLCRNWVSDFGWNPLMWLYPGKSDDDHGTYVGHRFPAWALLTLEEEKLLSKEKLEEIHPGPKYLNMIARNRARRFQQVIHQNMTVGV